MTRTRMAVVGVVGFMWLAAGCTKGGNAPTAGTSVRPPTDTSARALADSLRQYLDANGPMYKWEEAISRAVCNLEKFTTSLPPAGARYCPGNGNWPPSGTAPPKFPPN